MFNSRPQLIIRFLKFMIVVKFLVKMNNQSSKELNNLGLPPKPFSKNEGKSLINTGSATGTLRNKCTLKPGHSLMHWIRLGQSGKDLTGFGGRKIIVSKEELVKHNTLNDAWIALRGIVYNVTSYMDFHPGGIEELMRGVGKDATQLFTEVHAWVNYQQLLQKCCIGTLMDSLKQFPVLIEETSTKKLNELKEYKCASVLKRIIIPRFDWIQTSNDLCISVYTKKFSNPGFLVKYFPDNDCLLELWILFDMEQFKLKFNFSNGIKWPPKYCKVHRESGKLAVNFIKSETNRYLWSSLGEHQLEKLNNINDDDNHGNNEYLEFQLKENLKFNHDSWQLSLQCRNVILITPLGYHLNLIHEDNKRKKPYTPIPHNYSYNNNNDNNNDHNDDAIDNNLINNVILRDFSCIKFLYKNYYQMESFSSYLSERSVGDILRVSLPQGNFDLLKLTKHRSICFLAAGSGITPFLGLIDHLIKRQTNRIELLYLYYFNKTFEDIWCYKHLKILCQKESERFQFVPILTRSSSSSSSSTCNRWTGLAGHVSKAMLSKLCNKCFTFVATCGPQDFNAKIDEIVRELKLPSDDFYMF